MIGIDKAFILSFSPLHEKKKKLLEARLNSIPLAKNVPWEILELPDQATIGGAMSTENLSAYKNPNQKTDDDWQALSLAVGHWRVWQKAWNERHNNILVLEENFLPQASHYHVLNTVPSCDLIYLGRASNGGDIPLEGGLVTPSCSNGSFAYCIHSSGIKKFLESGFDQQIIPVGNFITTMHDAATSDDLQSLFTGRITALAPMKNFIEKDTSWNYGAEGTKDEPTPYQPLHASLYNFFGSELEWTTRYLNRQLVQREFDLICDEPIDNVYSFPIFTPLFCKEIIEEAEHYGEWTSYRGKDQDAIDIMLDSIGFNQIYAKVIKNYVYALFCHKYQLQGNAWLNLNSQNFIVRYLSDKQGHLGLHNDGSYLSMVVTLNIDYEGGGTFFPKFKKLVKHKQPGYASVHPGLVGYLHGARPVTKGKRYILASFFFPGAKPPITDGY